MPSVSYREGNAARIDDRRIYIDATKIDRSIADSQMVLKSLPQADCRRSLFVLLLRRRYRRCLSRATEVDVSDVGAL